MYQALVEILIPDVLRPIPSEPQSPTLVALARSVLILELQSYS